MGAASSHRESALGVTAPSFTLGCLIRDRTGLSARSSKAGVCVPQSPTGRRVDPSCASSCTVLLSWFLVPSDPVSVRQVRVAPVSLRCCPSFSADHWNPQRKILPTDLVLRSVRLAASAGTKSRAVNLNSLHVTLMSHFWPNIIVFHTLPERFHAAESWRHRKC